VLILVVSLNCMPQAPGGLLPPVLDMLPRLGHKKNLIFSLSLCLSLSLSLSLSSLFQWKKAGRGGVCLSSQPQWEV
jgi:hypothetical protein